MNFVIYGVYGGTTGFCSHRSSLPILLPPIRTMRGNSPWDSQMLYQIESEVPTQLLPNRARNVPKPCRFQGTLSLREF